jgi:hypothetical protein
MTYETRALKVLLFGLFIIGICSCSFSREDQKKEGFKLIKIKDQIEGDAIVRYVFLMNSGEFPIFIRINSAIVVSSADNYHASKRIESLDQYFDIENMYFKLDPHLGNSLDGFGSKQYIPLIYRTNVKSISTIKLSICYYTSPNQIHKVEINEKIENN